MIVTREEIKTKYLQFDDLKSIVALHYNISTDDVSIYNGYDATIQERDVAVRIRYLAKVKYHVCDGCKEEHEANVLKIAGVNYCSYCGTKIDLTEEMNND